MILLVLDLYNQTYFSLEYLNIFNNELTGSIPPTLGELYNLQSLFLHNNQISGSFPLEMYSLINLKDLYISNNNLSGVIYNDIQNLQSLERLKIQNNQFSNTLPIEICLLNLDWSNPANFSVSNNKFCAPYPGCLNG